MKILCLCLAFFSVAIFCQGIWIEWMRRFKLGQEIKAYGPEAHMKKTGTPNMGGLVALFMTPVIIASLYFCGLGDLRGMCAVWSYPVIASLIGLTDDVLKLRSHSSEGLKSMQKLLMQILLTVPWAVFMAERGVFLLPGVELAKSIAAPLLVFLGVGLLNAVNVTDGLDGLAAGTVSISLFSVLFWASHGGLAYVTAASALAVALAFLWHNANPASVFMGDVGSHFWAGLLLALCVQANALILVFPLGFIFGIEILTVAIQIVSIRRFDRKVFLMSPLHHHFELLNWGEPKVVTRFCMAHLLGMVVLYIFIFTIWGGGLLHAGS